MVCHADTTLQLGTGPPVLQTHFHLLSHDAHECRSRDMRRARELPVRPRCPHFSGLVRCQLILLHSFLSWCKSLYLLHLQYLKIKNGHKLFIKFYQISLL